MPGDSAGKTQMVTAGAAGIHVQNDTQVWYVLESWLNQDHSLDSFLAEKNNNFAEIRFQTALGLCFKHFTHFHSFRSKKFVHQLGWLLLAKTGMWHWR